MPKQLSEAEMARRRRINRVALPFLGASVLFLIIVLAFVGSDGPDSPPQSESERTTTTGPRRPAKDTTTTALPTTTTTASVPTTQGPDRQAVAITELRSYLRDNFGQSGYETSWYPYIVDLRPISRSGVDVVTSIYPDGDAPDPAEGVCHGVSGFIFRNGQTALTGLRVSAPDGRRLVLRMSLGDDCAYDG